MSVRQGEELVSVVVPARDEEASLGACLDSILAQDWPNFEVLVVDGDSTDHTADVVQEYRRRDSRVRLLTNPRRLIPVSLNLALRQAEGDYLVRVDAHASVPPDYVRIAVGHLRTGAYGGVGGRKDAVGTTPAGRAIAAAMGSRFGVGDSTYHFGTKQCDAEHVPFGAYPMELLRRMGGWDEALAVNQDFELDYRLRQAGYRILFDPELRIDWQSRQKVRDLFRQYERYGRGKVAVARMHPGSLRLRHGAAPALVLLLFGAGAAAVRRPRLGLALAAPYIVALSVSSATTSRDLDRASRRYVGPAFLAMHVGWGLGFWRATLRSIGQRVLAWQRRRQG